LSHAPSQATTITGLEKQLQVAKNSLDQLWQAVTETATKQQQSEAQQAADKSTMTRNFIIGGAILVGLFLVWRAF
jgi:CHASE3 domain sensor protein